MRESRTYGSVRGARGETRVPTATGEIAAVHESGIGRLCCKSRKLQGHEFFAKTSTKKQSPIRITSIALPKSPVSLT